MMSFYEQRILPRVINVVMNSKSARATRTHVCGELAGDVIEVGFGTGLNVPHYPMLVTHVSAVEPSERSVRLAQRRLDASPVPVAIVGLDGQRLHLPNEAFDHALSTWTLCTIPDVAAALSEIYRVLKPGGVFHFVEHGLAPDQSVVKSQRRLEPWNRRVAGGCHLTRDIPAMIRVAGFEITTMSAAYAPGTPRAWGYQYLGQALKP